ncbi:hypothetical protein JY462_11160 [Serratia marcescens]|nr:hypothetical protein [Serratia marcescens]
MDKLREEFEDWLCKTYDWGNDTLNMADFYGDDKTGHYVGGHFFFDGKSCSDCLFWAWEGWKASRASIVVELPPINIPSGSDTLLKAAVQMAVEVQTNKCAEAIRSIGLSIKGEK